MQEQSSNNCWQVMNTFCRINYSSIDSNVHSKLEPRARNEDTDGYFVDRRLLSKFTFPTLNIQNSNYWNL